MQNILTCSFFIIVYYVYCFVCILLYANVIALYISFYFFSTQHYVFKMHRFAFLYNLFIASNTTYLSRYTFITLCLSTLPMIEISNSLPPNNNAFFKHCAGQEFTLHMATLFKTVKTNLLLIPGISYLLAPPKISEHLQSSVSHPNMRYVIICHQYGIFIIEHSFFIDFRE